ncbi:MAG: thioredoxin-disulfide reductase [Rickettsiaceae bacterium]
METTKKIQTQLMIIGSGPAGLSAAIYSARAALKPILLQGMEPGGQLTITTDVENYPGFADIVQGPWLMEQMTKQAENVGTKLCFDYATSVDLSTRPFIIKTGLGKTYAADSVIISTGAQAKWLGLESETKYQGFGVSGCATCDGVFFKDQEIVVIGGGNTAVEEAMYLTNHANKVHLIHRRDSLRAEKILQERLFKNKKINVIWNHVLEEILGNENPKSVTHVKIKNVTNNQVTSMPCSGVFIAIGHKPNTELFKDQLELDDEGYIITKSDSTQTSVAGVFAAGDVQDKIFRQAVTAAGTGCMAALEAEKFLNNK